MQFTVDISEKDLIELGKETIQQELAIALKWVRMKQLLHTISAGLSGMNEVTYYQEVERIRESAWNEYKEGLDI